jgi:alpha-tubulin suppressor-like RCC1 family protein
MALSDPGFVAVSASGHEHTCGLTIVSAAYCWGGNFFGQLGNGTTTQSLIPIAVSGGLSFAAVSAGFAHTCGLTSLGAAYCWGLNDFGQLGDSSASGPEQCVGSGTSRPCSTAPVPVSGGLVFRFLSSGGKHTCGITSAGAAYCWGWNGLGQLGNGTTTNSTIPVAVSGAISFAAVSAGDEHTCGITNAGAAYCWGANAYGEVGNGDTTQSTIPVAVSGGHSFATVSAGAYHTCGVTLTGVGYCWGDNVFGALGNGSRTQSPTPVAVSGGLSFAMVSAGFAYTCGLTSFGAAYCWGEDAYGELGDGTITRLPSCSTAGGFPCSTTPVAVSGRLTFTAVSAGAAHTCGVTIARVTYCWGEYGQLGNGSNAGSGIPVLVAGQP